MRFVCLWNIGRGRKFPERCASFQKTAYLIAKLQQLHPDSDLTEIDVWRLFDDNSVAREIDAKFEQVQEYLASGDLDGMREFIEAEIMRAPGN
jgi:hypothetical protein